MFVFKSIQVRKFTIFTITFHQGIKLNIIGENNYRENIMDHMIID